VYSGRKSFIMNHHELILLFLQFGVMLAVAVVSGQIMRWLRQPPVLGELIGGIILGPTVFGYLAPDAFQWLFPADKVIAMARGALISVGMLFFLFVAGLEVKLSYINKRRKQVALTSLMGCLVPMAVGVLSVKILPEVWGWNAAEAGWFFPLFVGIALSISALPVIARIFIDLKLIDNELGMTVMAAATIDDVIGWTLFAAIMNFFMVGHDGRQLWINLGLLVGLAVAMISLGRWLGRPLLQWIKERLAWPTAFIGLTTVVVLGSAAITEALGIHAIFGAYLVGIALGQNLEPGERNEAHDVIFQFAMSFFAPLYFVSIGLQADFARNFDLPLVLLVLLVACIGKIGGAGLGAWLAGSSPRDAIAVGFGMNARGAMEMILASVALEMGLIDQRIFVALVVMALVTSLMSGPVIQRVMTRESG
jgi:Kef-type K+ transport system membrane component KefB